MGMLEDCGLNGFSALKAELEDLDNLISAATTEKRRLRGQATGCAEEEARLHAEISSLMDGICSLECDLAGSRLALAAFQDARAESARETAQYKVQKRIHRQPF